MGDKPFTRLATPRVVDRPGWPSDLVAFYAAHEGIGRDAEFLLNVGMENETVRSVRLCRLDEAARVGWSGLGFVGDTPEGWEGFIAVQIGFGICFEEIVYVLAAPSCPPGSILAIGSSVSGPGGIGPDALETSLVLAASFTAWLAHLERWAWDEPVIAGVGGYPKPEWDELRRYYVALNPNMDWGPEG